jgi:hypothetical protein
MGIAETVLVLLDAKIVVEDSGVLLDGAGAALQEGGILRCVSRREVKGLRHAFDDGGGYDRVTGEKDLGRGEPGAALLAAIVTETNPGQLGIPGNLRLTVLNHFAETLLDGLNSPLDLALALRVVGGASAVVDQAGVEELGEVALELVTLVSAHNGAGTKGGEHMVAKDASSSGRGLVGYGD